MVPVAFDKMKIENIELEAYTEGEIKPIRIDELKTKYTILIFYPLDFTFVCPTELVKFSSLHEKFKKRDCTVLYISTDSVYAHKAWSTISQEHGGIGRLNWPMVSDKPGKLSRLFNVYDEDKSQVCRATVIYNNHEKRVKHLSINCDMIGRSSKEVLRLIEACDFSDKHGSICPIDFEEFE